MFHILGFLFFIILVVLVIGLLILSKVIGMVFGFKRRMQGKNSGQRTTYSSQNYQSGNRQEETFDSYSTQGDVPVRQRKRFSIKTKGNTWNSKKSTKNPYLFFRKKSFISPAHSSASTPFTTTVFGCRA